jgi:hypothetical protein
MSENGIPHSHRRETLKSYNQRLNGKLIDTIIDYCLGAEVLIMGVSVEPVF